MSYRGIKFFLNLFLMNVTLISRKPEMERILSAICFIRTPRALCNCVTVLYCVIDVLYSYDLQMGVVKYFFVNSIKSEFFNKENVDSDIWNISNMYKICDIRANSPLVFSHFKHLQVIDPSFVTITKQLG